MRYIVQWRYSSSYGGPWDAGADVDLDAWQAEAINRDSPGVLAIAGAIPPDVRMEAGPVADRMVRSPSRKRGAP